MKTRIVDGGEFANQNPRTRLAAPKVFSGGFAVAVWFLAMTIFLPLANAVPVQLLSARNPSVPLPAGGDDNSAVPSLSPDGRFVVFTSAANDLVPGGNSVVALNVFLRDRTGNTTMLVSGNLSGTGGGNGNSMLGQASTNGQFVVFQSDASNLVPNDTNGVTDIFVSDLVARTTTLVSMSTNGGPANGASTDPVITPDGRYVAFISSASNLVPGDTNGIPDVFVRDLIAGTNCLVSVGAFLAPGGPSSIMATPVITPGWPVCGVFQPGDKSCTCSSQHFHRRSLCARSAHGHHDLGQYQCRGDCVRHARFERAPAYHPRLSDDGRYVAFKAGATTTAGAVVILQYDSTLAATAVVNTNGIGWSTALDDSYGPEMTPDGRFIAFARHEGALNSGYSSVHVWDTQLTLDTLVSDDGSGVPTNTTSYAPVISPDGQFVAFLSNATNLVSNAVVQWLSCLPAQPASQHHTIGGRGHQRHRLDRRHTDVLEPECGWAIRSLQ